MARSRDNSLVKNFHGKFGKMIIRTVHGQTIISKPADYSKIKWSKLQKSNRHDFSDATAYAQESMSDPEMAKYYKGLAKPGQHGWNMAISDFMSLPEIEEIDPTSYHGVPGDVISVKAYDKYHVALVLVAILDPKGNEVEEGMAVSRDNHRWFYETKEQNPSLKGSHIMVKVVDVPGNVVTESIVVFDHMAAQTEFEQEQKKSLIPRRRQVAGRSQKKGKKKHKQN